MVDFDTLGGIWHNQKQQQIFALSGKKSGDFWKSYATKISAK